MSTLVFTIVWQRLSPLSYLPDFRPSLAPSDPLHYCWTQLPFPGSLASRGDHIISLGTGETRGQQTKSRDRKKGKEKVENTPVCPYVIVEVQTDTRKPPPPPDGLPDEKGHTLLRTRAQCSPGWPGTRESVCSDSVTYKQSRPAPSSAAPPPLLYFPTHLLFSQAFSLQRRGQALPSLSPSSPCLEVLFSMCEVTEEDRVSPCVAPHLIYLGQGPSLNLKLG